MFSSEVETKGIRLILTLFRATRKHTIKKVSTPSRRIIQRDALLHDRTLSAFGQVPVERRLARLSRMWNHRGTPPSTHPPVSFFLRSLRHVCHHGPSNVQSPTTFPQPFSPFLSLSLFLCSSSLFAIPCFLEGALSHVPKDFLSKTPSWFVVKIVLYLSDINRSIVSYFFPEIFPRIERFFY